MPISAACMREALSRIVGNPWHSPTDSRLSRDAEVDGQGKTQPAWIDKPAQRAALNCPLICRHRTASREEDDNLQQRIRGLQTALLKQARKK